MNFGSFDRAIANSKLSFAEKYKKASLDDLNVFKNTLGANVHVSADGKKATIILNNSYSVDVVII